MGYSVVLWNIPEYNIADGTIVPVFIKSNISHVYVIEIPETKEKIEVPLWQLSEPAKLKKAQAVAAMYTDYEHTYARCILDGLPIRADKVNTSKQVYRLRKGEVIRTLYEASGVAVMSGQNAMEGKWLRVITNNGVMGWCFSYNLRLFQTNADGSPVVAEESETVEERDEMIDRITGIKWYPENYSSMIKTGNIDFEAMSVEYGFYVEEDKSLVRMKLPKINIKEEYSEIVKKDENVYKFNSTHFQITVRNKNFIVIQYTNETGKPVSYNFISLDINVDKILSDEQERRSDVYKELRDFGPDFKSSNYGTLTFESGNRFKWDNFKLLVPSVITKQAKGTGTVAINYFLSAELKKSWDGAITCHFEGMEEEVVFLYKIEKNGLRLEDATRANKKGNVILARSSNSLVMFFAK